MDPPKALYVLLQGSVAVCKDTPDGRKYIVTNIEEKDIFGEVYVFWKKRIINIMQWLIPILRYWPYQKNIFFQPVINPAMPIR
nr:cyclic nucleotide-binding domain-containing protein [Anaerocolumna sedimenticola]